MIVINMKRNNYYKNIINELSSLIIRTWSTDCEKIMIILLPYLDWKEKINIFIIIKYSNNIIIIFSNNKYITYVKR